MPAELLERGRHLLAHLAGLDSVAISATEERAADSAAALAQDAQIFLDGVVDPEQEKKRLTGQREKLARDLESASRKLRNETFLAKARPEVVEKERAKAADLASRIDSIDDHLRELG